MLNNFITHIFKHSTPHQAEEGVSKSLRKRSSSHSFSLTSSTYFKDHDRSNAHEEELKHCEGEVDVKRGWGSVELILKENYVPCPGEKDEHDSPERDVDSSTKSIDSPEPFKLYGNIIKTTEIRNGKTDINSFVMISMLGSGTYGKVFLVKKRDTGRLYAMKVLKKKHIRNQQQFENTMAERKILEKICHPFVVKLKYAF